MNETAHRKHLLIQQIAAHRELMRRDLKALHDANPVTSMVRSGRELLSSARNSAGTGGAFSQRNLELATTVLPVALQVLKVVHHRHEQKRTRKHQP